MNLLRAVAKQPLDWHDPRMVRIQQETRLHLCRDMSTFEMVVAVCTDEEDATAFLMTLTQIKAASTQGERAWHA
jgi:hypothetical protein